MQDSKSTRWLHIPMEIVDRELYPKLLLASEAIKDGWSCVIGTKRTVLDAAEQLPKGVVYLKSVIPSEYDNMMRYKENGHRLVCLDEEGLIQSSLDTLVNARYTDRTVAEAEKFYCWGDIACNALKERYPNDAHKFMTTGSPTADLWSFKAKAVYQEEVDKIHERFGKYILIPSSFAVPNHYMGPEEALKIMERDNMFRNDEERAYYKCYHDYVEKVFEAFKALLPVLSKEFPDHTIILRPHPSDHQGNWREAVRGLDNVKVVFEGPVSPWLFGADAVFHWGSTTGLEAYLLGRPVVGHTPLPEEEKKYDVLPHLVSVMTHTQEEVIETLRYVLTHQDEWVSNYPAVQAGHAELKKWMHNLSGEQTTGLVLDDLNKLNVAPASFDENVKEVKTPLTFKEIIWRSIETFCKIPGVLNLCPERIQIGVKSRDFGRHKTKGLEQHDIEAALRRLSDQPIKVRKLANQLYMLSR